MTEDPKSKKNSQPRNHPIEVSQSCYEHLQELAALLDCTLEEAVFRAIVDTKMRYKRELGTEKHLDDMDAHLMMERYNTPLVKK